MGLIPCTKCNGRGKISTIISEPPTVKTVICPRCGGDADLADKIWHQEQKHEFYKSILLDHLERGIGYGTLAKKYGIKNKANCRRLVLELISVADMMLRPEVKSDDQNT